MPTPIIPNLWFDTQAEEAARFYCSVFPNSRVIGVTRYADAGPGKAGTVMTVDFELDGQRFVGINGGPQFPFTEAVSFQITCADQEEVDHFWEQLHRRRRPGEPVRVAEGPVRPVVAGRPDGMEEALSDADPERARRAMEAMLGMTKLDLAALHRAADAVPQA